MRPRSSFYARTLGSVLFKRTLKKARTFDCIYPKRGLGRGKRKGNILHNNGLSIFCKLHNAPCSVPTRNAVLFVRSIKRHPRTIRHVVCGLGLKNILSGLSNLVVKRFARCRRGGSLKGSLCNTLTSLIGRCSCPVYFSFPIKRIDVGMPLVGNTTMALRIKGGRIGLDFGARER